MKSLFVTAAAVLALCGAASAETVKKDVDITAPDGLNLGKDTAQAVASGFSRTSA